MLNMIDYAQIKGQNMQRFFGRESIIRILDELWGKNSPSFVTCRGRRRVGKSTLIERFAEVSGARFLRIEGAKPNENTTDEDERRSFAFQLSSQTGAEDSSPSNWLNAFIRLSKEIDDNVRTVVLLDEVSWMGCFDHTFSATLKIAWDNHLKKHSNLVFVVCGSVSTWIRDNIIDNKAFYGRRSLDIVVPELPLSECVKFWGDKAGSVSEREILDMLAVTGGIPRYLEELNPSLSCEENLRRMCFVPNAPLRVDFDDMFTDVITKQPRLSAKVMHALVSGPKSITELSGAIGVGKGGDISCALSQLEESGMVAASGGKNPKTGTDIREKKYRIKDNYSRFYLKYIEPVKEMIDSDAFAFSGLSQFPAWDADLGYQFENLVVNNFRELLPELHLQGVMIKSAAPYVKKGSRKTGEAGCQVDLLIQTASSMYVVEIKRKARIEYDVIDEIREKCRHVPRPRDISLRTVLVYSGELAKSVVAAGYFDSIVPFARLIGLR